MGEGMEWSMATWQPGSAHEPGVVYINRDHPVLCKHVEEFQEQYPQHYEETIAAEVLQTYGRLAVAHVAHSEQMLRLTPRQNVERLRTDEALTMALLGMWQVEAIIAPQLGGKFGKIRKSVTAA